MLERQKSDDEFEPRPPGTLRQFVLRLEDADYHDIREAIAKHSGRKAIDKSAGRHLAEICRVWLELQ